MSDARLVHDVVGRHPLDTETVDPALEPTVGPVAVAVTPAAVRPAVHGEARSVADQVARSVGAIDGATGGGGDAVVVAEVGRGSTCLAGLEQRRHQSKGGECHDQAWPLFHFHEGLLRVRTRVSR